MKRLGMLMEPEPGNPLEVEGVLNPAGVRGPDGQYDLFPRLVAKENYSRIGIIQVKFNDAGDPVSAAANSRAIIATKGSHPFVGVTHACFAPNALSEK
jgi:hypothetical protein